MTGRRCSTRITRSNTESRTPGGTRGVLREGLLCFSLLQSFAHRDPHRSAAVDQWGLQQPDPWGEMLRGVIPLPQVFKHNGYAAIGAGKIFTHGKAGIEQKDNPSFDAFYKLQPPGKSKLHADKPHMNYNGYPDGKRFLIGASMIRINRPMSTPLSM